MAYIGKSPSGTGVRQRYYFTATGGETTLGASVDDNGLTLSYSDGAYVDVLLNGIELVAGTDYNTNTANRISGLAALAASDVVTVTVYDIFTVADTVSAKDGGTFSGNVVFNGNTTGLDLNGTDLILDADGDSKIEASTDDTINIVSNSITGLTIDSAGRVFQPKKPSFLCRPSAAMSQTTAGWRTLDFATVDHDIGSNLHADGYFVAPVDGVYHFDYNARLDNVGSGFIIIALALNNTGTAPLGSALYSSTYVINGAPNSSYDSLITATTIELDANDKVVPWAYSADTSWSISTSSSFSGFLIG
jgi:hypothetical protein